MKAGSYIESIVKAYLATQKLCKIEPTNSHHFIQTWGSTSLGFEGIGGQAFTDAYTTVILIERSAFVYFNGDFAYYVNEMNEAFIDDLKKRTMRPVNEYTLYYMQ